MFRGAVEIRNIANLKTASPMTQFMLVHEQLTVSYISSCPNWQPELFCKTLFPSPQESYMCMCFKFANVLSLNSLNGNTIHLHLLGS